jgi:multiphosphoryl transfer protein
MVGIVLVSHSRSLALSVQELVRSMTGPALPLAIAAGVGDDHKELGTDAVEIAEAIVSVKSPDGILVLMDMGSAILSAETAVDFLEESLRKNVRFCAAPFVEGAVASGVTANLGASLDEVCAEAMAALKQKEVALRPASAPVETATVAAPANGHTAKQGETIRVTIRNEHGLHARPAARLITETRPFHSDITVRNLSNRRGPVSIKSLSSLAALEILQGNEIEVAAEGDDAAGALKRISELIESGLGDTLPAPTQTKPHGKNESAKVPRKTAAGPVPISDGIAIGVATRIEAAKIEVPQHHAADIPIEINRLQTAVAAVQKRLASHRDEMSGKVGAANAEIYEAQMLALQDPDLVETATRLIREDRANAAQAWNRANRQIMARYESLHDPYLRERATDLEDVGQQVLELLVGRKAETAGLAEPGIVIADNLTPNQVSSLNAKLVRGVILLDGGPTAHSSILLRAMGIPSVVQARSVFAGVDLQWPTNVALDGSTGKIWINPDADFLADLQTRQVEERKRAAEELKSSALPAATLDGHHIEIFANIGDVSEVEAALHNGAEGVGLLRTEFLFLERQTAPTEEEQYAALLEIAMKMGNKPLIVRTLDVGGDKALPYLDMPAEENPFLGVRAIRLCLSNQELFTTHLRAILRAGHGRDFRIMFPMIASVTDLERAKKFLEQIHVDLEIENVPHLWPVKTGIMIEIPSAALLAESMAQQADFFSIGTNDLTQYTLAADRGNPDLASYQDALHPGVLRLIEMVVSGARKHDCLVAVCGEAASDDRAAAVFVGLGVQELSLTSAKIPHLKASLRKQSWASLQKLAHSALHCHTAAEVRALQLPL